MTGEITSQSQGFKVTVFSFSASFSSSCHTSPEVLGKKLTKSKRLGANKKYIAGRERKMPAGIRWPSQPICRCVRAEQSRSMREKEEREAAKSPSANGNNFSPTESPVCILRSAHRAIHSTFQPLAAAITHFPPPAASQPEPSFESSH
jgi:hypothetical protein